MTTTKQRYELLQDDDVIQKGDLYTFSSYSHYPNAWGRVWGWELGKKVAECSRGSEGQVFIYRRPLTTPVEAPKTEPDKSPGEGYRWVAVGERLEEGDEWCDSRVWTKTACAGDSVPTDCDKKYRRKVTTATPPAPEKVSPEAPSIPLRFTIKGHIGPCLEWFNGTAWVAVPFVKKDGGAL